MDFLADINNALPRRPSSSGFGLVGLLLGAIGGDRISGLLRLAAAGRAGGGVAAVARDAVWTWRERSPPSPANRWRRMVFTRSPLFTLFAKTVTYALAAFALLHVGRRAQVGADGAL